MAADIKEGSIILMRIWAVRFRLQENSRIVYVSFGWRRDWVDRSWHQSEATKIETARYIDRPCNWVSLNIDWNRGSQGAITQRTVEFKQKSYRTDTN